jgi:hypothetical protein
MLKRFYDLRQDIADFMDIKGNTINQVKDDEWVCDLASLVDVTGYLNELNLKLQKQGQLVALQATKTTACCAVSTRFLLHWPLSLQMLVLLLLR